jgi:hypothetical protein
MKYWKFDWTPEADAQLLELRADGMSDRDIALVMGVPHHLQVLRRRIRLERPVAVCRHCKSKKHKSRTRGLCYRCNIKPEIRTRFPSQVIPRLAPTARQERTLRRMHAKGHTDNDIADHLGVCRRWVGHTRRALRLPPVAGPAEVVSDRFRAKLSAALRKAYALGLRSRGGRRPKAHREYSTAYNLPTDLPPKAVNVLLALLSGPMTRRQIAARIGMRADHPKQARVLRGSGRKGTLTALLLESGLIAYMPRYAAAGSKGGRVAGLYVLTLKAASLMAARREGTR